MTEEFKRAGSVVGGLKVGSEISNTSSIGASLNDYRILDGIREIPMEGWNPENTFYAADDDARARALAIKIKENGYVNPLIVMVQDNEPYVLEGLHRLVALGILGVDAFPALVVIDEETNDDIVENIQQKILGMFTESITTPDQKMADLFVGKEEEVFEDAVGNLGQAASVLRSGDKRAEAKAKSKEEIKALADKTTEPHVDRPPKEGGQHVDLPYLAKWLKDGAKVGAIARIYSEFMDMPELRKKLMVKKFDTLDKFVGKVHEVKAKLSQPSTDDKPADGDSKSGLEHAKRYEDENLTVYLGTDEETTIQLSCKNKYGLCIGVTGGGNYFNNYRFEDEQSTYFVYFKNEEAQASAKTDFIIIDIDSRGDYQWNPIIPNSDRDTTEKSLISIFPTLKPSFDKGVYKYVPPTEEEMQEYEEIKDAPDVLYFYDNREEYATPIKYIEYMLRFIQKGEDAVSPSEWTKLESILNPDKYKLLLQAYVEQTNQMLPTSVAKTLSPQMLLRYFSDLRSLMIIRYKGFYNAEEFERESIIKSIKGDPSMVHLFKEKDLIDPFPKEWESDLAEFFRNDLLEFKEYLKQTKFENMSTEVQNLFLSQEDYMMYVYVLQHGFESAPDIIQQKAASFMLGDNEENDIQNPVNDYVRYRGIEETPENIKKIALEQMYMSPDIYGRNYVVRNGFEHLPEALKERIASYMDDPFYIRKLLDAPGLKYAPENIILKARELFDKSLMNPSMYALGSGLDELPDDLKKLAYDYLENDNLDLGQYAAKFGIESLPEHLKEKFYDIMIGRIGTLDYNSYIQNFGLSQLPAHAREVVLRKEKGRVEKAGDKVDSEKEEIEKNKSEMSFYKANNLWKTIQEQYEKLFKQHQELLQKEALTESTHQKIVRIFTESITQRYFRHE